ncbi:hypothetical protein FB45DRAFT_1022777 [Roridomyces roridus]|uniref:Yeast cell wall synthesis Kre9/Knh1-like N-terminal domain-containing protein n=1 Tax=Roridomyces roridus TaxID=1738132 RepID=A0AAD7FX85_9AGAR|nr:hypothetical protein FB45DRAFT_1022777 [Roridomyces roridus]
MLAFMKLSGLLAVGASLASALKVNVPTNPTSGATTQIDWTSTASDPSTFSLFLANITDAFDLKAIIGEFIDTSLGEITVTLPTLVAEGGYVLNAVNAT